MIEEVRNIGDSRYDNGSKRTDEDLDSITVGSSSKMQVKIYFNSKKDKADELETRIDWIVSCAEYLEKGLNKR